MNQIIPAILPKSQTELEQKASSVLGLVQSVQVDVCDGIFVASKTEFESLPFADQIDYELDLMIQNPENTISKYLAMKPKRIVLHVESLSELSMCDCEIGLAIGNDTPNEVLEKYIDRISFIQLMGIAKIGFQGEPFDDRVLEKIIYFHSKYPNVPIAVDGGVSLETIERLRDAGVTRFVCGSAVFNGDVKSNIEKLESLIQ